MISARHTTSSYDVQTVDHSYCQIDSQVIQSRPDVMTFQEGNLDKSYENPESLITARTAYRRCDSDKTKLVRGHYDSPQSKGLRLAGVIAQLSDGSVWFATRDECIRLMRDRKRFALDLIDKHCK